MSTVWIMMTGLIFIAEGMGWLTPSRPLTVDTLLVLVGLGWVVTGLGLLDVMIEMMKRKR